MKININNYEEWMIDYIEGNLSDAQVKEMQEFLTFHPELKAELDLFNETKLQPDTSVVFEHKESLKKAVGGRVVTMYSWVKYAASVAAVVMVFAGVRWFNSNNTTKENVAIKKYQYQQADNNFAFDRTTDSIEQLPVDNTTPKEEKNYFADNKKKNVIEAIPQEEIKEKIKRELNPIQSIDFAKANKIKSENKIEINANPIELLEENTFANNTIATPKTTNSQTTNISLNDNKNVIDWWQDAVAIGGEVGEVIEGVKDYDLNPIEPFLKHDDTQNEVVKTRNINILGFNYYSRKK